MNPAASSSAVPSPLTYRQRFDVPFSYDVVFTRAAFDPANPVLSQTIRPSHAGARARVLVLVDAGVAEARPELREEVEAYFEAHAETLELVAPPRIIAGGEQAKNGWRRVQDVMDRCNRNRLCRQSYVIAIGGGAMLDMAGFAVSLVHRGLRLVRMPSTVLAQNDAGVGVKTGMNEYGQKNFAGTFAPPFAVVNDFDLLDTLPYPHWVGGIAEAFKVAMICDAAFYEELCELAPRLRVRDRHAMERLVHRCAELHLDHIGSAGDPFEMGTARPLDFGHWSAHRLEVLSDYTLGHGQAVAIGIMLDTYYAMRLGLLHEATLTRTRAAMQAAGLPTWSFLLEQRAPDGTYEVIRGLEQFQEHLGGELTITLPDGIGKKLEIHEVDTQLLEDGIAYLRDEHARAPDPPEAHVLPIDTKAKA